MKHFLIFSSFYLFFCAFTLAQPTQNQTVDLTNALVAYYPLNGNANDASGNGNHGTVLGATLTKDKDNKANCAYNFKQKGQIECAAETFNEFSVCAWFYVTSTSIYEQAIVAKWDNYDGPFCVELKQQRILFELTIKSSNASVYVTSKQTFKPNTWYHVVCTKDMNSSKIYINGILDSETIQSFVIQDRNTDKLRIGSQGNHNPINMQDGNIDEVRYYSRAINANEVNSVYNFKSSQIATSNTSKDKKTPVVTWLTPANTSIETTDLQYTIKATIQSSKTIKSIKVISGGTTLVSEPTLTLTNGQATFEKNITLNSGTNEISISVENADGIATSSPRTIKCNLPQIPPLLSVTNISFSDKNSNNRIDGNEDCSINFTIVNKGKGAARNVKMTVQNNSAVSGLTFSVSTILKTIEANSSLNVNVPISGTMSLTTGTANFKISFVEQMGFPPDPFELNIDTKEFLKPNVQVVDNSFLTDNGSIKLGLPVQLKVLIQNVGQGTAENVKVSFQIPSQNVFPIGEKDFTIGTMAAGATKELIFEFIANKIYTEKTIPITVKITEKLGKYAQDKNVTATIDSKTSGNTITITSNANDNVVNIQVASLSADVDKNIPQNATKYPNRYALLIGNEDYSSRQTGLSSEVNVAFAVNDAKIFKEYVVNTFGVEEKNCYLLTNATAGEMAQKIELLSQILTRLGNKGELIFYYAGHGFPDENTKIPYLIPVDVNANNLQSAIKLTDIYSKFAQTKAKRITIFLDACFTGGGREQGLLAARSVKIKPKQEAVSGNVVVFTATSEDQSALPFKDKQHGIFTYFLLKKIQDRKGDITYSELDKYVRENVSIESLKVNGKAQDPQVNVSADAQSAWENWKVK